MDLTATEFGGVWAVGNFESRSSASARDWLNNPAAIDALFDGGRESSAGEIVSVETALCLSVVWRIVSKISRDTSRMPLSPFKRTTNDQGDEVGKTIDKTHPAFRLLRKRANESQTSRRFRRSMIFCALMCSNSYAYIERRGRRPVAMRIMNPLRTCVKQSGRDIYIESTDNLSGAPERYELDEIVHMAGPSWDGFEGLPMIRYARDTFGMALAAQRYTSRFFKNGVQAGGVLKLPLGMKKQAGDTLEEGFTKKYQNPENWFKVAALRDGAEFQQLSFNAKDADLKELRNQAKVDCCDFFGMNPALAGVPGYSSYNSQSEAKRQYLDDCLSNYLDDEVDAYECKLFTEEEYDSDSMKLEHNTNKLLEMNLTERAAVYASSVRTGWLNNNEVRAKENMPPREGGELYANPPELSFGSSAGGADKTPDDPTNPNEPGKGTAATNGRSVELTRVIFKITDHARAKSKRARMFLDWMKGGLSSHHTEARALGVDGSIVARMLEDFQAIKADDATISEQVEVICRKWEDGNQ